MSGLMDSLAIGSVQAQAALGELLWIALKGSAVLAAGFGAALLLRRSSASRRHLAWAASFAVLAALPAWTILLPAWELELGLVSSWEQRSASQGQVQHASTGMPMTVSHQPAFGAFPPATVPGGYPAAGGSLRAFFNRPELLLLLWLLVAAALVLRWGAGYAALRRSISSSRPLRDAQWQSLLGRLSDRLGLKRAVDLRLGASRLMPLTWGVRRPGVLLPAEALSWEKGKREIVLLHELAHIRRRDVLIQHITAFVSALYWFNPLVWAAWRRLRKEREGACDDLVLSLGTRPSEYARQLLSMAQGMRSPAMSAPALSMAHRSQLEGRLLAILDPQRARAGASGRRLLGMSLLVILMAAPLAALSPAWRTPPQQAQASAPQSSRTAVQSHSTHSSSSRAGSRSGNLSHSQDGTRLEIRMEGVRISNDYELAGIDPGGYLEIVRRGAEGQRRLEIKPSNGAALARRFFVNGEPSESQAEAEVLLDEAMQMMRSIDRDRERVHGEVEEVRQAQAQVQQELQRSRQEMEMALSEAERALQESHREHRVQLEAAQRQLEESLSETRNLREEEMRRIEDELQRARSEMELALKEAQRMRETEMARMQDEMRRLEQELVLQNERLRDELDQELRQLEEERERLQEVRLLLRQSISEAILKELGSTDLRNDAQAWAGIRDAADDLASEILSEGSSIRVDDRSIRFSADSSGLTDRIRRLLDRTLPGGLSGLDQGLQSQLHDAISRLSAELADFRLQR